jgi:hypothetical protein
MVVNLWIKIWFFSGTKILIMAKEAVNYLDLPKTTKELHFTRGEKTALRLYKLPVYQKFLAKKAILYCIVACKLLTLCHQTIESGSLSITPRPMKLIQPR